MPWFCPRAFEDAHITADGSVYLCCSGWVDHPIGQVCCHSLATIWNNEAAQRFRESIHDGSFRHCVSCPYMTRAPVGPVMHRSEVKDPRHLEWLEKRTTVVTEINQLIVAYDRTCNLSCPSCRHEVMAASGRLFKYLRIVQNAALRDDTLSRIHRLTFSGGEPFASRIYRELIHTIDPTSYPNLSICLQTNGLLFSEEAWFALGPARSIVRTVAVSIDAATPETYVVNRRGGDWWKLQQRLEFIARLRRSGSIHQLRFCFVVQANNFREMPDFIELARRNCADMVFFTPLRNCGTYGDVEFCRRNVHAPEHPEHGEYLELCRHIPPVVRLSGPE